ncbi:hypothetical protein F5Y06DRAFT_299069 [Hypoxylon sp. FL0890]|nr:hypothetical protein F5Y06DRAFT_299069 [Hypoxylon sp. FL0890]
MTSQGFSSSRKFRSLLWYALGSGSENPDYDASKSSDEIVELALKPIRDLLEERGNKLKVSSDELRKAQSHNTDLEQRLASMSEIKAQNDGLKEDYRRLKEENESKDEKISTLLEEKTQLRYAVEEKECRIFSLLPYRQELTTYDAVKEYERLIGDIENFVSRATDSILDSVELQAKSVQYAQSNQTAISEFANCLSKWKDLYDAAIQNPDIDHEILNAFILRFLWENVFSTVLCDTVADTVPILDELESAMKESTDPKPDLFCVKSWRAQANLAMVTHPTTREHLREARDRLSANLALLLGFMRREEDKAAFEESILADIIDPALTLHQNILTSTNEFWLETDRSFRPGHRFEGEVAQLKGLECVDVAKNLRDFIIDKLSPIPSADDLRKHLHIICSTRPALVATEVGRGLSMEEPAVVCKERMLVAWIPQKENQESIVQQGSDLSFWLKRILSTLDSTTRPDPSERIESPGEPQT